MDASLSVKQSSTSRPLVGTTLSAQQIYQRDPLLVLLKDKVNLNDLWVVGGFAVLTAGVLFGLAALDGAHFGLQNALLGNTFHALLQTLTLPILLVIYLRLPFVIANLFNTLNANRAIGEHRQDRSGSDSYEDFLKKVVDRTASGWWTVGVLAFVVLYALYRLLLADLGASNLPPAWLRVTTFIIYVPVLYATILSFIRLVAILIFTNWLFHSFTINVNPLHPDGSAGLGVLESMLGISTALLVTMGMSILLIVVNSILAGTLNPHFYLEAVVFGVTYLFLAPILLVGWLILPHQTMIEARDMALQPLADQFKQVIVEAMPSANDTADTIKAGTDRLDQLKRRYELLRDTYPTWPTEIVVVRRLVATVSIPALLPFVLPVINSLVVFVSHSIRK